MQDELKRLRVEAAVASPRRHQAAHRATVLRALACERLPGRDFKTIAKNRYVLKPLLAIIGGIRLRDLGAVDVDHALAVLAASRSTATVGIAHWALTRSITRAQAKSLIARNVLALTGTPEGHTGRPSRSMTLAEATALLTVAQAAVRGPTRTQRCHCIRGSGLRHAHCGGSRRLWRSGQRAAADCEHRGVAVCARESR